MSTETAAVMQAVWALVRSGPNFDGRDKDVERAIEAAIERAVAAERERCAMEVWCTLQEATGEDADDKGLDGWMREAEQRIRNRGGDTA